MADINKAEIIPDCRNVHHWGSFRPMPTVDPKTKKTVMIRMCPHCTMTMAEFASKQSKPKRSR